MPFGTITVNTKSYDPRSVGVYSLSTLSFGNPADEFRLKGATIGKDGLYRSSVIRLFEKDVVVSGSTVRKAMLVNLGIQTSTDFTAAEIDSRILDISEFVSSATLTRLLAGES